mmetsp:Transcript_44118/g.87543  ORF Transcript_44118/g.87543 Transcript_44118/m.87543 type:complete len:712 (-) Transcript_44118:240-2375(-)
MVPSESLSHRGDQAAEISWESSAPGDTDLQVHVARNSQKLIQVESGLSVVNGRLDEWSKVTLDLQACLMDMQASQSFCRLASWMSSITNPMQTGGTPSTAASELSDETSLSHRCLSNVFQNIPGAQAQETHFSDLVVVLERAAANCESRMAARCAAVEAVCEEMRGSLQELCSVPEGELHQSREGFHAACHQAESVSSLSQRLDALESASTDTMQQLSDIAIIMNAKTDDLSELAAVRDCVVGAAARCDKQFSEVEVLRAQLAREVAKQATSNTATTQINGLEESNGEAGRDMAGAQPQFEIQLHQQYDELRSLREYVERRVAEQNEIIATLRNAASTVGTGSGEVATLAQQLSAVQEEQKSVANVVKFVSESVAEAAAASIRRAEDDISAMLSAKRLEAGIVSATTSTSASGVGTISTSHMQDSEPAQAAIEDMKTRVLALEQAICLATVPTAVFPSLEESRPQPLLTTRAGISNAQRLGQTSNRMNIASNRIPPSSGGAAVQDASYQPMLALQRTWRTAARQTGSAVLQEDISAAPCVKCPEAGAKRLEAGTAPTATSTLASGVGASCLSYRHAANKRTASADHAGSLSYPQVVTPVATCTLVPSGVGASSPTYLQAASRRTPSADSAGSLSYPQTVTTTGKSTLASCMGARSTSHLPAVKSSMTSLPERELVRDRSPLLASRILRHPLSAPSSAAIPPGSTRKMAQQL